MAKAGSSIKMKIFIRDSGRMAKNMDMGSILISRARFIKANGLMIWTMAKAKRLGMKAILNMRAILKVERRQERADLSLMETFMKDSS
jgi:hypothetical protein